MSKEIKEDTDMWKHILCSWIRRINNIEMTILPKAIYTFNTILITTPMAYFIELEQIFQRFMWNYKRSQTAIAMLRKKSKVGENHAIDMKLHHKAIITKTT